MLINQSVNSLSLWEAQLTMARTPKVVEDRRDQIMDAALRVFARQGFDRATNKDIAREAGITPGLIYHYFESKEDLLKALLREHSPLRLVEFVPQDNLNIPVETLLRDVAFKLLHIVEDEHYVQLARIFLSEALYQSEASTFSFFGAEEVVSVLERYLSAQMERGILRKTDPELVVQIFGGSLMALVLRRQIFGDPIALHYSHEQIVDGVVSITLQGLLQR
jgi:AcrR family transcriptional regulator